MNSFKKRHRIITKDSKISLAVVKKRRQINGIKDVISLLKSKNAQIRNSAALTLRDMQDNKAVKPLMKAIKDPGNKKDCGTLVYALEVLDCSKCLLTLVDLALHGNYEVQNHALTIITEQSFKANPKDISKARAMIEKYLRHPNKCEDYQLLIADLEKHLLRIGQKGTVLFK